MFRVTAIRADGFVGRIAWNARSVSTHNKGIVQATLGPLTLGQTLKYFPLGIYYNVIDRISSPLSGITSCLGLSTINGAPLAAIRQPQPQNIMMKTTDNTTGGGTSNPVKAPLPFDPEYQKIGKIIEQLASIKPYTGLKKLIPSRLSAPVIGMALGMLIGLNTFVVPLTTLAVLAGIATFVIIVMNSLLRMPLKDNKRSIIRCLYANNELMNILTEEDKKIINRFMEPLPVAAPITTDLSNKIYSIRYWIDAYKNYRPVFNRFNLGVLGAAGGAAISIFFSHAITAFLTPLTIISAGVFTPLWVLLPSAAALYLIASIASKYLLANRNEKMLKNLAGSDPAKQAELCDSLKNKGLDNTIADLKKVLGKKVWNPITLALTLAPAATAAAEPVAPPPPPPPAPTIVFTTESGRKFEVVDDPAWPKNGQSALVYKVKDDQGRIFAVKLFSPDKKQLEAIEPKLRGKITRELEKRFNDEIDYLEAITKGGGNKNIVSFHGAGKHLGTNFMVIEFIPVSLKDYVQTNGVNQVSAIKLVLQIVNGLDFMFDKFKLIHRDLKPENVLIDVTDTSAVVKITDMGTGKSVDTESTLALRREASTQISILMGTPRYWSTESILLGGSKAVDSPSADIFALGIILYNLITIAIGRTTVFPGLPVDENVYKDFTDYQSWLDKALIPDGFDPSMFEIIKKMMKANPKERFQTYAEIISALTPILESLENPGKKRKAAPPPPPEPPVDRTKAEKRPPASAPKPVSPLAGLFTKDGKQIRAALDAIVAGNKDTIAAISTFDNNIFTRLDKIRKVKGWEQITLPALIIYCLLNWEHLTTKSYKFILDNVNILKGKISKDLEKLLLSKIDQIAQITGLDQELVSLCSIAGGALDTDPVKEETVNLDSSISGMSADEVAGTSVAKEFQGLWSQDNVDVLTVLEEIGDGNIFPEKDELPVILKKVQEIASQAAKNRLTNTAILAKAMLEN